MIRQTHFERIGRTLGLALVAFALASQVAAIDISVRSPRDGQVVFGTAEVELEVLSGAPVAHVVLLLDGEEVARLTEAPFVTSIDFGEENRARTLEIVATDVHGEVAQRTIVTGAIEVHDEVDLNLQQLYVTATRRGRWVRNLKIEDFQIFDDGRRQRAVTFERGDVPLTAVLLIDSSLSMEGEALEAALYGARTFVESMQEFDEAKVLVFSDRLLAATPFTGDPDEVSAVMESVEASGGTAVNDHLFLALEELDQRTGRQVVVLLSDGIDVESLLDMRDVAWKAGRMQALIYWIRPSTATDLESAYVSVWRDAEAYREEVETLQRVVRGSGGSIREIERYDQAADAFRQILRELREQYVLGYYPDVDRNDDSWHEVRIRVRQGDVDVRARDGYFDDQF